MAPTLSQSAIERILAGSDEEEAIAASPAAKLRERNITPAMKKLLAKKEAQAAGEDPRVTEHYTQVSRLKGSGLPSGYVTKKTDELTSKFFDAHPDLDPRIADQTVSGSKGSAPAEMTLQAILRLATADGGGEMQRQAATNAYGKIKGQLTPAIRKKYNLDEIEASGLFHKEGIVEGVYNAAPKPVKMALGVLDRPSKRALTAIGQLRRGNVAGAAKAGALGLSGIDLLPNKVTGGLSAEKQLEEANFDKNEDGAVDMREVLGINWRPTGALGKVVGAVDTAAVIATDPTTYVTLGASGAVKSGVRSLERQGEAQLAKSLSRQGWKVFTPEQKIIARAAIQKDIAETIRTGATKKIAKAVEKAGGEESLIASKTDKIAGKLEKGGRKGVKVAGRTVLPYSPFAKGHVAESTANVTRSIRGVDVLANDVLPRLGNAEVIAVDPATRYLTVQPQDTFVVSRKGVTETIRPGEAKVGDTLYDGDAIIRSITPEGIEVELKNTLWHGERQLDVMPQHGTGGQGELWGNKNLPADTQGKLFDKGAIDPGTMTGDLTAPSAPLSRPAKDLSHVPVIEGGDELRTGLDSANRFADTDVPTYQARQAAKTGEVVHIPASKSPTGDDMFLRVGEREGRKVFDATLQIGEGKIKTIFREADSPRAASDDLFKAAEDAGIDVGQLDTDTFTPQGKAARDKYVARKAVAQAEPGRAPRASVEVTLKTGGTRTSRVWRSTRGSGDVGLPDGSRVAGVGEAISSSVDPDGNMSMIMKLDDPNVQVGQPIPEVFGKVSAVNADGTVTIVPAQQMTPHGNIATNRPPNFTSRAPSESPVEAPGQLPGLDVPPKASEPNVARLGEELEPLTDKEAYAPGATKPSTVAKITQGSPVGALDDVDRPLFSWGPLTPSEMDVGDRIRSLKAELVKKTGRNKLVAKFDDVPRTVRRPDFLGRVDLKDVRVGDVIEDTAKVIKINPDGTLVLRTLDGGIRAEDVVSAGGTALSDSVRRARIERRAATVRGAFQPRGAISAAERSNPTRIKPGSAERYYGGQSLGQGRLAASVEHLNERLGGAKARLYKALGDKQAAEVLTDAFDVSAAGLNRSGKTTRQVIDGFRAAGNDVVADALEIYETIGNDIRFMEQAQRPVGVEMLPGMDTPNTQLPLIPTKQGREALVLDPAIRNLLTKKHVENLSQGFDFGSRAGGTVLKIEDPELVKQLGGNGSFVEIRFNQPRAEVEDQLVTIMNAHTKRVLGFDNVEKGHKMFETDPTAIFFMRGQSAARRAAEGDMLEYLSKPFGGDTGLVRFIKDGDEAAIAKAASEGLDAIQGFESPLGRVYAHREIAQELGNTKKSFTDETLKQYDKALRWYSNFLARYQTSAITKGTGFALRNELGNIWVNTMKGVKPQYYTQAAAVMNAGRQVRKIMKEQGLHWDDAVRAAGISEQHINALRLLQDNAITRSGFFRNASWDEATKKSARITEGKIKKVARAANPFDSESILTRPGRAMNQGLEDHSRIAHFLSKIDELGSVDAARESVRVSLFDYSDLTPWEQQVAKRVNRFYTYMRKNMALQAGMVAHWPGRTKTAFELKNMLMDSTESELLYPGEDREGKAPAGDFLRRVLGGGARGVVQIDTPLDAAFQDVDPMAQIAYANIPGLAKTLPLMERPTKAEAFGSLLDYTAGGPAELVTTLFEFATGVDTYTKRELDEPAVNKKLIGLIAPMYDQSIRSKDSILEGDRTDFLRLFAGIVYYKRDTETAQTSLAYAQLRELEDVLARLKDQGQTVMTITELRDAGFLPDLEASGARTVKLTPAMRKEAARQKLANTPTQTVKYKGQEEQKFYGATPTADQIKAMAPSAKS